MKFDSPRRINKKATNGEYALKLTDRDYIKIVKEFYDHGQDGSKMEAESRKAKMLLGYIHHLQEKYAKENGEPMPDSELRALGFDIKKLEIGEIKSS